jgi:hypothetical protein
MARGLVIIPLFLILAICVSAQTDNDLKSLRTRLEQRFQILPVADGLVLTPRSRSTIRSIEVSDGAIAVDGSPVTGAELRGKLGVDADLVLQVSYLDPAMRRVLSGAPAAPSMQPVDPTAATPDPSSANRSSDRSRRRDALVRIGGNAEVGADEFVEDDVVVIGGNATIDGEVDGDLVVVGGSARLGPRANIHRDVTVVGGTLERDPNAVIGGRLQEVGFAGLPFGQRWASRRSWSGWNPMNGLYPIARFMGTLVRVGLLILLAALVILVARTPVEQIADRAAAEPVKSWAIGFLAQILFVPVLILTAVVLAISIIGIPLLLLLPVAVVAAMVLFLVGFTGVAYHVGRLLQGRVEYLRTRPYIATFVGIAVILSPLLLARIVGLAGQPGVIVGVLVAVGMVLEYIAWTTGLGAAALVRFGRPVLPTPPAQPAALSP